MWNNNDAEAISLDLGISDMKKTVTIQIGEYHVTDQPTVISTVLGSCVAVCLYDQLLGIGGMNHIMLPGKAELHNYNNPTRFAINAMELLIDGLMKLGARKNCMAAKVFGGAQVISVLGDQNLVGLKNVEFVIDYLDVEKIRISNYSVGGNVTRKIFFHTDTCEVMVKKINSDTAVNFYSQKEQELQQKLMKKYDSPGKLSSFD